MVLVSLRVWLIVFSFLIKLFLWCLVILKEIDMLLNVIVWVGKLMVIWMVGLFFMVVKSLFIFELGNVIGISWLLM